jgi:hypothetical protein
VSKYGYIQISKRNLLEIWISTWRSLDISPWEVSIWEIQEFHHLDETVGNALAYVRYLINSDKDFPIAYGNWVVHIHSPEVIEFLDEMNQVDHISILPNRIWVPLEVYHVVDG